MDINALYRLWLEKAAGHPALREELEAIRGDDAAIEDRFYRELEFGTGGLRGVLGAGTNRMNVFTVGKATQGYANYLKAHFAAPSVAIAYDSRINSRLFAETTAGVFAANGIRVHIYPRLMPTPSLSFAVRDLRSCGGVVITASHNPAKYNGYKVYGADGCQITTEAAAAIQQEIDRIDPFADVHTLDFAKGLASGVIAYIGEDTVERYLAAVSTASLLPESFSRSASIVYTPLNGTGISCVPRCLRAHGFTNISIPPEQAEPDGTFPTCPYPNPEIREALSVGLRLAEETGSELLLARQTIVVAARAAGIDAVDTVFSNLNDMDTFKEEVRFIKQLGFDGKSVINPRQINPVNEIFTPTTAEIDKAKRIIAALKEAEAKGSGVVSLNGKMIDKPVVLRAERTLELARAVHIVVD